MSLVSYFEYPKDIWPNVVWRFPKNRSQKKHCFVIGAPRSGTTLLQIILAAHSKFGACEGETAVFTLQNLFDLRRRHGGLSATEITDLFNCSMDIVTFFDNLAEVILRRSGGARFVEKTPQHVFRLRNLTEWYPQAQFVNIYRDGRDCFCSAKNHPDVPQGVGVKRFASYWRKCILARLRMGQHTRILDVKYEEFTAEPDKYTRKIMRFLGEAFEPQQLDASIYGRDKRSYSKQFALIAEPVTIKRQNRWRAEMTDMEVAIFNKVAGEELRLLGYSVE
ncbi:MAG: sulfotransferase [Candidatus Competibacteraceae bacterium]